MECRLSARQVLSPLVRSIGPSLCLLFSATLTQSSALASVVAAAAVSTRSSDSDSDDSEQCINVVWMIRKLDCLFVLIGWSRTHTHVAAANW